MSLKHTLERFRWIKVLWSPFKPFKVSFYAGKTQVGVPYFYPRKWIKATPELAYKAASENGMDYKMLMQFDIRKIRTIILDSTHV